ncbi:MAG: MFS transporter [Planctomycetota bacterium]|nr:MFS transporter [Planctomycetota bacterium]MDP7132780.1 MFS transporter [Planctomycetota bacterium]MDP7255006.1 MFS transporter [Planctomycetota bacterium]
MSNEHPSESRRYRIHRTLAYYGAFVALGLVHSSLGPTLPDLAEQTQARLKEVSFLFTTRSFGYLLGALGGGRLFDRALGHPVLMAVLLIMAVTMALVPFTETVWMLATVLCVLGLAEGTLDVGCNTLLVWSHPRSVGPFMNGLHFFFGVGSFLSPIVVAEVVYLTGGIKWAFWVLALLNLPVVFWLMLFPGPPIPAGEEDNRDEAKKKAPVAPFVLFFLLYVGAEVAMGGWVYAYALTLESVDKSKAAYLTSAFWGALTVGRLLGIPASAKFRPVSVLAVDLLGCLLCAGLMLAWQQSLVGLWITTLGLGLSMASIFPMTLALAGERMTITGRVTGWFFVGSSIGSMTLPWLIGQLFESEGPWTLPAAVLFVLVCAGLLLIFLSRPTPVTDLNSHPMTGD